MTNYAKMFKQKPKKVYTGPPRPNLMSHDKVIRGQKETIDLLQHQLQTLQQEVESMRHKLNHQTQYLAQVHSMIKK